MVLIDPDGDAWHGTVAARGDYPVGSGDAFLAGLLTALAPPATQPATQRATQPATRPTVAAGDAPGTVAEPIPAASSRRAKPSD